MILYIRVRKSYFQRSDFYTYCSVIYVIYNHKIINMYVLSYHLSIKIIFGLSITILLMKKLSYAYLMTHFVYTVKWYIGNVFNKPPRQNAPTDRVLTSVILKRIEWAFRKVYPTKIPGMVHQGLLAPQSLRMSQLLNKPFSIYHFSPDQIGVKQYVHSTILSITCDNQLLCIMS